VKPCSWRRRLLSESKCRLDSLGIPQAQSVRGSSGQRTHMFKSAHIKSAGLLTPGGLCSATMRVDHGWCSHPDGPPTPEFVRCPCVPRFQKVRCKGVRKVWQPAALLTASISHRLFQRLAAPRWVEVVSSLGPCCANPASVSAGETPTARPGCRFPLVQPPNL